MNLNFAVSKAIQNIGFYKGLNSEQINLVVDLTDQNKISIGEDYLFANANTFRWSGKGKKEVECKVLISRDCEINKDFLKNGNIGLIAFHKEFDSGDGEYFSASIFISIYINDELFNKINANLRSKLFISHFSIEVNDDNDELKYSWEPDGSHQIWKNSDENLALHSFNISFTQESEVDVDLEADLDEAKKEKDLSITKLFRDINAIRVCLYVIVIAVIINAYKIFS